MSTCLYACLHFSQYFNIARVQTYSIEQEMNYVYLAIISMKHVHKCLPLRYTSHITLHKQMTYLDSSIVYVNTHEIQLNTCQEKLQFVYIIYYIFTLI